MGGNSRRVVAEALMRHHNYDEGADSVDWLRRDVDAVLGAVDDGAAAIVEVLLDAAWFDPEYDNGTELADAVASEVLEALGAPDA